MERQRLFHDILIVAGERRVQPIGAVRGRDGDHPVDLRATCTPPALAKQHARLTLHPRDQSTYTQRSSYVFNVSLGAFSHH